MAKISKRTEQITEIDKDNLDEEWCRQPRLYFEWACFLADAQAKFDHAKRVLETTDAELGKDIRKAPQKYGLDKVTDKAIDACVATHPDHIDATQNLIDARHELGIVRAAVDTLDHKKKALESLVYLQGQGYFSSPAAPKGMKDRMQEVERRETRKTQKRNA